MRASWAAVTLAFVVFGAGASAQRGGGSPAQFIKTTGPVIALTHVRVIDGTGAPARADQTIVIRDGTISAMGDSAKVPAPEGATVVDLTGKSVIPGLVMLHEHLYYPTGPTRGQFGESFVRLYLAGGVTTMRTAGDNNGIMDFNLKRDIDKGTTVGPAMDATAPYLNGPNNLTFPQQYELKDAADARSQVDYWADMGATSFKAYMHITRAELGAAIDEAHKRGFKLTGHLCSVTFSEAVDLGIDNLEHGFLVSTDTFPNKTPDVCPGQTPGQQAFAAAPSDGPVLTALIKKLVDKHVPITSTLPVFENNASGRPMPPGLDVLVPELKQDYERTFQRTSQGSPTSLATIIFKKEMALERAFVNAGGMLVAGIDPTGAGGVIPGYADQREVELLVEEGFTPLEAIEICTLNGAKYLGRDKTIGSLVIGKQADLVVVGGDPSTVIADVRKVETVFKHGVGYDAAKLIQSVSGKVGLW